MGCLGSWRSVRGGEGGKSGGVELPVDVVGEAIGNAADTRGGSSYPPSTREGDVYPIRRFARGVSTASSKETFGPDFPRLDHAKSDQSCPQLGLVH